MRLGDWPSWGLGEALLQRLPKAWADGSSYRHLHLLRAAGTLLPFRIPHVPQMRPGLCQAGFPTVSVFLLHHRGQKRAEPASPPTSVVPGTPQQVETV